MAESNAQTVRDLYALINERPEPDQLPLDLVHPEVELISPITSVTGEGYQGHDGLRRWAVEVQEQFEQFEFVIGETREAGDRVLALGHIHLRGQASGIEMDQPVGWLIDFTDGKVRRVQAFTNPAEAVAAFEEKT